MPKIQKIYKFCGAGLLLAFVSVPGYAIMNGQGHDIFPATAIFKSSVTVIYSNDVNAGITISSGLIVTNGTIGLAVSGGNVGIGTMNPIKSLEVIGDVKMNDVLIGSSLMVGSDSPAWNILDVFGNVAIGTYAGTENGPDNGLIVSGNVGIGTTGPTHKLHVTGNAIVTSSMSVSGSGFDGTTNPIFQIAGATMTVLANGNVGIGTTEPNRKLELFQQASSNALLRLSILTDATPNVYESALEFYGPTTSAVGPYVIGRIYGIFDGVGYVNARTTLQSVTAGPVLVDTLSVKAGNVGIGTTGPNSKLHVASGDVYIETQGNGVILRDTDGAGCHRITVNTAGTITAGVVTCP